VESSVRCGRVPRMLLLTGVLSLLALQPARADITIGVILSLTGPAASLGIPAENTVKLWPSTLAGQTVHVIVVNDKTKIMSTSSSDRR
jgi:branched-chain amino acid transport system substrate-binding protein